jgi:DNA invertase Pin-like site-specific DNA recombinase
MTQTFIAYTRVSTQQQGDHGVSLIEQRRAIERYSEQHQLSITAWHEECVTAAKRGRPEFTKVLRVLKSGRGNIGLLMHKIDRGARNLKDWADIGEVIDRGITIRFAHDDLDLHSHGGRLAADIQAVIAADYIRNLREEVRKGIRGRLNQGFYPFKAPFGYLDWGSGRVKVPDPYNAPLVITAFKRYATNRYTLCSLAQELAPLGFSRNDGGPISTSTSPSYCTSRSMQGYAG